MKLLRAEPVGVRSILLVTTDGIVTAVIAEHAGTTVPDDEVEPLRGAVVDALNRKDVIRSARLRETATRIVEGEGGITVESV